MNGTRNPVDHDVVIVGAGFGGLYQLHRLRALGLSVILLEAEDGLGGVWHANRYPGARVDTNVPIYEFSDEAVWRPWYWDELFPSRDSLVAYFAHVDRTWNLRPDIELGTRLEGGSWEEAAHRWQLRTSGGGQLSCRFLVLCTGFASKPYLPALPGLDELRRECHHTAWWPSSGTDMTGLRVGVLGTGASGVQVVQEAAKVAASVTVFQRTPNTALPMRQRQLTRAEQDAAKDSYPLRFRERLATDSGFGYGPIDASAVALPAAEREATFERLWDLGGFRFWAGSYRDLITDPAANRLAYDFWSERTRARIHDPELAEQLAPTEPLHPFGAKRPSLEQGYYDAFNQDNVTLVDLRSAPLETITETGVRASGVEHDVDLLVLATGFDAVTGGLLAIDLRGARGTTLADHWRDGLRTHLGMASAGFPNLFYLYGPQSPSGFCNGPTCAEAQGDWLVDLLGDLAAHRTTRIEPTSEAEDTWGELVRRIGAKTLYARSASWYTGANIPGKPRELLNWPGGLRRYLALLREAAEQCRGFVLEEAST